MTKYETRRTRLIELINSQCKSVSEFSRRIGMSPTYAIRMTYPETKKGFKRIGEDLADKIHAEFGLPDRWLDGADVAPSQIGAIAYRNSNDLYDGIAQLTSRGITFTVDFHSLTLHIIGMKSA